MATPIEAWWIRGEGGAVHRHELPLGEGIPARLRSGALVRVNEDGSPWTGEVVETAPATLAEVRVEQEKAENAQTIAPVELPDRAARKSVWVTYAVSKGMTRGAAEDLTKDELIARYGG